MILNFFKNYFIIFSIIIQFIEIPLLEYCLLEHRMTCFSSFLQIYLLILGCNSFDHRMELLIFRKCSYLEALKIHVVESSLVKIYCCGC